MSKTIGIIAEDRSDIEVIDIIISKYIKKNAYRIKKFVGCGCGKIKQKCDSWANNLFEAGCQHVFIFHDLDRNNEKQLRTKLKNKIKDCTNSNSYIIIPIEEIEAWLLADLDAVNKEFKILTQAKQIANPESITSPKEYIEAHVWKFSKKRYLNTVHNKRIAEYIDINKLHNCAAFVEFEKLIKEHICA